MDQSSSSAEPAQASTPPEETATSKHPHDSQGHFIHKDPQAVGLHHNTIADIDAPLVSVTINNPFKKILYWLNDIRRKQTTEFDINAKLKIPLPNTFSSQVSTILLS